MNINKSVSVCCAKKGYLKRDLANHLKLTTPYLSVLLRENSPRHIAEMAAFFDMAVSDFIREGE